MLLARDFRRQAVVALRGKWGLAVGTGLVAAILGGTAGSGASFPNTGSKGSMGSLISDPTVLMIWGAIAGIMMIYGLVVFLIGGPVSVGYCRFNMKVIRNDQPSFQDLFSAFNMFGRCFLMQLLRSIFTFLWTLLLIIPGIIAIYRYAMAPYLMEEHPDMTAMDAIQASKEMMAGNKWRLFCLDLSFIGWAILCVFSAGIGFLWLTPYQNAARAAFYLEISGQSRYGSFDQSNTGYEEV